MIEQPEITLIPFARIARSHRVAHPHDCAHIVACGNNERGLWVRMNDAPVLEPIGLWLKRRYIQRREGEDDIFQAWGVVHSQPVWCRIRLCDGVPLFEWKGVTIGGWTSLGREGNVTTLYVPNDR